MSEYGIRWNVLVPANLFAAGLVILSYSVVEMPKFIRIGAVPNFFVVWVLSELAMLK